MKDTYDLAIIGGGAAGLIAAPFAVQLGARVAFIEKDRIGGSRYPLGFSNWLCALDFYLSQPKEIAIIGPRNDRGTLELLHTLCTMWLPNKVVAARDPNDPAPVTELKLLENRQMIDNRPTAYVCYRYSCKKPVTDAISLSAQLRGD
ncbi:unnamed protein product [marine sediment metagenome]|uniref:FAD-dependent oxidoreductase 2 FAD-binding domain-containing protein n=1 Tax=marine sediment metagenome TaxID=412755 RepID=X1HPX9_9ZZZZ